MRRRKFLMILGGAGAWPLAVRAQQPGRTYRIGFVVPVARDAPAIIAFLDELRLRGFIEGQNLVILPSGFEVRNEQIAEVVASIVKAAPDAILSGGDLITAAFQNTTHTIPLMVMTEDLVGAGFAASLARPGSNMTGISLMSTDLDGKRQEILTEAVPGARRIAALADSNVASLKHLQVLAERSQARGLELLIVRAASRTSCRVSTMQKRGARRPSMFCHRLCCFRIAGQSSTVWRYCVCRPSTSGPKWQKKVACSPMAPASFRFFGSAHG